MRCFVTGGTGVVGRRVVDLLVADGHDVTVLSRRAETNSAIEERGATPVRADLFDRDSLTTASSGHDAFVNLATSIPPLKRAARRSAWSENDRIRTEGADAVGVAARANDIGRLVQESVTFTYVDGGDDWISEDHPRSDPTEPSPLAHAEEMAHRHTRAGGDGVVLRFGQFYAPDSSHTQTQAVAFRWRINAQLGRPGDHVSLIAADSAARAVVASLRIGAGTYNVVDDDPPTRAELGQEVERRLGRRRAPLTVPVGLVTRINPTSDILMRSHRVSNAALVAAGHWTPDHSGAEGYADSIEEILG